MSLFRSTSGRRARRGFTLVELLVVIAILAVLAVTVVVVLNPAELLRQSRDSTRLSDLASMHRALGLYLADGLTWSAASGPRCTANGTNPFSGGGACGTITTSTVVSGGGWVDVDLTGMSTGAPLSRLPLDPTNDTTYFYAFKRAAAATYEIDARMESNKYATTSATQVITKDGGDNASWYEVGNEAGLDL